MIRITLNDGHRIPALGFGVFQTSREETGAAVRTALETGYRLIDTAAAYLNERQVGEGLRASGVPREKVTIETKVWINDYGYDRTLHAFEKSVHKLKVDYLDVLILHQPMPAAFDMTVDAYRALETLQADGRVRTIGVSNFMVEHLEALLERTTVIPALNQIEVHPYFSQPEVREANRRHGIVTQAWSPIGGITSYGGEGTSTFDDPEIGKIAARHQRTPAQVMLRWHLQEGRSAIPKSVHPDRIRENFGVFNFELDADELAAIDRLDTGIRRGPEPEMVTLEDFGREIPEE